MAMSPAARRLTEAHRLSQARLGAATVARMQTLWPLLDPAAIDASVAGWLRATVPVVQAQNQMSARLSARYYQTFRQLELGRSAPTFTPTIAAAPPAPQIATSLTVTGPATVKSATARLVPLGEARVMGMTQASAAALRLALLGGRDTVNQSIARDPRALGYARVTSAQPCAFCAMLASRGPVYSKDTGSFQAHDSCSCTNEPVYRRDAPWPPGSERFRDLWNEAQTAAGEESGGERRLTGNDALNAFRRTLAGQ